MVTSALLASEIDMGNRKGLDSIIFRGIHSYEGANVFWPQGEITGTVQTPFMYVHTMDLFANQGVYLTHADMLIC